VSCCIEEHARVALARGTEEPRFQIPASLWRCLISNFQAHHLPPFDDQNASRVTQTPPVISPYRRAHEESTRMATFFPLPFPFPVPLGLILFGLGSSCKQRQILFRFTPKFSLFLHSASSLGHCSWQPCQLQWRLFAALTVCAAFGLAGSWRLRETGLQSGLFGGPFRPFSAAFSARQTPANRQISLPVSRFLKQRPKNNNNLNNLNKSPARKCDGK